MQFPLVILLLCTACIGVNAQSAGTEFRIKKIKFLEALGDGYTAEYSYDDSARVTRVEWHYIKSGTRLSMGERKTEYVGNRIICTYVPNESAKEEFMVKNYYFKEINKGDIDSIYLQDGKVHEVVQLRSSGSRPKITRYSYKYSTRDLLLSETILKISDTVTRTFQYSNGFLAKAAQRSKGLIMQVAAFRQSAIDSLIVVFKKHEVPRGEVLYICEYEGNLLRSVREPMTKNEYFFRWDKSNNLTEFCKRSEIGLAFLYYEYEQGSGNADLFQRDFDLIDYFFPKVSR